VHFRPNKPDQLLSILAQWVHFRVKTRFIAGHFVIVSCVFIHIAGSISIFNISLAQRPVPDADVAPTFRSARLDQRVREPPQQGGTSQIGNRQSQIDNHPQAGIFHPFGADSRQPTVGGQLRSAVISPPIARCLLPTAFRPFRPSDPDAGILPCWLRRLDGLGFEKVADLRADMTAPRSNTQLLCQPTL
jgi:hypothetical protein